ncbi:hypothetical protein BIV25_44530 [Streptomyces sp. MUSC 14]|nr:hypothetical protein BIV25_44530 [Streptomyces sp. MUSC 14]
MDLRAVLAPADRIRACQVPLFDADPKAIGPRSLILFEEVNATMKQLARYWEKIRESGDPKVSPAVDALNEILYMGRQLHARAPGRPVRDRPRPFSQPLHPAG